MNNDLEEKIIGLESRLAFAEDTITGLNTTISDQNKEIHSIRAYCLKLKSKIDELAEADGSNFGSDEKPPHY